MFEALNAPTAIDDPAEYFADGSEFRKGDPNRIISRSDLYAFGKCPHRWLMSGKKETSTEMNWGSLVDCLWLTPQVMLTKYAYAPATYPSKDGEKPWNWAATVCKEWREKVEAEGRICIKQDMYLAASDAANALDKHPIASEISKESRKQVWAKVLWKDEETGVEVPIKALIDLLPYSGSKFGDTIFDLKTTAHADYRSWVRHVFQYGLHYQAAMYIDIINASGKSYVHFGHIIQESSAPYETCVRLLGHEFIALGRMLYRNDLKRYCRCLKTGVFPGLDNTIVEPEAWMMTAE